MKKLKLAFFGTPDFAVPVLELLHNHPRIELLKVVSMPDRKAGRGQKLQTPPVAQFAKENKIPLTQTLNINKEEEVIQSFHDNKIDIVLVLAFAQFLGKKLLETPLLGCFNIHTSLLPLYRGAAPIQHALLNGDSKTGVTIQKMVKKMDAGDIALTKEVSLSKHETLGQLYTRLKFQAALSANEFIEIILNHKICLTPQDETKVTFAPTLKREDGFLNFSTMKSQEIKNKVKAFNPWPGTYCFLGKKRLKVFSLEIHQKSLNSGQTCTETNELLVGCLDSTLRLHEVQLEGKRKSSDINLINGLQNIRNNIVINPNEGKDEK
jgi:methionyl-tRNA formyltransferase